jgi:hypothetical protein
MVGSSTSPESPAHLSVKATSSSGGEASQRRHRRADTPTRELTRASSPATRPTCAVMLGTWLMALRTSSSSKSSVSVTTMHHQTA